MEFWMSHAPPQGQKGIRMDVRGEQKEGKARAPRRAAAASCRPSLRGGVRHSRPHVRIRRRLVIDIVAIGILAVVRHLARVDVERDDQRVGARPRRTSSTRPRSTAFSSTIPGQFANIGGVVVPCHSKRESLASFQVQTPRYRQGPLNLTA